MDVFQAIKYRRSVREFLPNDVPKADLERILDMARHAPTAGNGQPWKFLPVREMDNKARLRKVVEEYLRREIHKLELSPDEVIEHEQDFIRFVQKIFAAPVIVFVFVDASHHPQLVGYDGAMAVLNMMLAACALGYGTSFQTTIFPDWLVKDFFSVPDDHKFICAVPIGRPAIQPKAPSKKPLSSLIWEEQVPI